MDNDFFPASDLTSMTNRIAVGIGRRQRELPQRKSEPLLERFTDNDGILGGQHRSDAPAHLLGHGCNRCCR